MNLRNARLGLFALLILPLGGPGKADLYPADQAEIQRLIRQLGSESYQAREAASRDLEAIGEPAQQALQRAMHDPDAEVRRRAAHVIEDLAAAKRNREMAALQGFWVLKTTEFLGETADQDPVDDELEKLFQRLGNPVETREVPDDPRQYRTTLAFTAGTFERRQWIVPLHMVGRVISTKGIFRLDLNRSPKVMERTYVEEWGWHKTQLWYCIYSVRGDTLQMCVNLNKDGPEGLPTTFATDKDENVVLLTFKRESK